jgi:predicted RNA-binding protein
VKNWLVIHSYASFCQHNNLIGIDPKHRRFSKFKEIQIGDKIAYYAKGHKVIIGIFEVVSDLYQLNNDFFWANLMVYRLSPLKIPNNDAVCDFREIVKDNEMKAFPNKKYWGSYLMGKNYIEINEEDMKIIFESLSNSKYYIKKKKLKPLFKNIRRKLAYRK